MAKGNPQREKVEPGIYRRKDAAGKDVFEISWRVGGHQRRKRVGGGITAARAALKAAHVARDRREPAPADPRLTFAKAADAWWDARAVNLRPATQNAYEAGLKHLRPRFGNKRLSDITPGAVAAFVTEQRHAGLKGWTVRGQLTVLSSVYNYAGRHLGFTGRNPVSILDRVERPNTEDERDKRVLNEEELRRLLGSVDEPYRLIFETAAETGARLGETLGLVWGEVDLNGETITFTHQLDRKGRRVPLKTKRSRRTVEVRSWLVNKLRATKMQASGSGKHDLVFVSRSGTAHDHRNIGGRVLTRAVKRAGLEAVKRDGVVLEPAPTFHSLRHSHGSALIAGGWDLEEVSARLGHSNVSTTARVYVHAYDRAKRSAQRRSRLPSLYADETASTPAEATVTALPTSAVH